MSISMEEYIEFFNDNVRTEEAYNTVRLGLKKPEPEPISVKEIILWTDTTTTGKNFMAGLLLSVRMLFGGETILEETVKMARGNIINTLINNAKIKGLC